jgi:hypothetical protein
MERGRRVLLTDGVVGAVLGPPTSRTMIETLHSALKVHLNSTDHDDPSAAMKAWPSLHQRLL